MDFRVLGPLEVDDGGRLVPVRGAKQRALLSALLVRANEVVPEERLLDELWGDRPPASGGAALRVRVSQLRKALGGAGSRLVRRSPGYLLEVSPDELDARRFEALLEEGKNALRAEDARLAATTLREALALWRGPAFADVCYEDFARAEIARLEELRVAAVEERIEADLALGRHAELVGELEALVADEPLRERPVAQLMTAFYGAGRQAEALGAYREVRQRLVEELGIEPGPALQELERAMLRQDASLAPVRAPATAVSARPERKLVTVLAADLAAPGALGDDPERARAILDRSREAIAAVVEEAGGRLETVAGDAVTASFGAPVAQEDHAERALHAALAIRRRFEELLGDALALRIGVDTGEAVVGHESLASSALTTAARLCQAAEAGGILAGERTAATARGGFELGPATEGGRPLLRALSLTRPRTETPFVGRSSELESLLSAYRRVVETGRPALVSVAGDAGVGKTRLAYELFDRLAGESPEPLRRTGRCPSHGRGTTYRPLVDVLREELGLLETDRPETVLRRLGERPILGLTLGLDVAHDLHPLRAREALHDAWAGFLGELAARQPTLVLVEDLHWAHEPLLDLLEWLLDEVSAPLLLVATARPELAATRPSWGRHPGTATIWLEPLPPAEASRLLDGRPARLPRRLRQVVLERAEGNPFFLEELAAGIADSPGPTRPVPDSVQAALAARIDLLPPTEKAALQSASVIGRVFWRGPVRELLDGVLPDFGVLEARDFVRRRTASSLPGEREFAFKHALTRDVAYSSLPVARRARLHAKFADWLEERAAGHEHAALLAHHFFEAVRPEDADLAWEEADEEVERLRGRAVAWLRRAAEPAIRRYELDDALAMLHRALELAPGEGTQLELWRWIAHTHALRHDGEAFLDAMLRAIALPADRATMADLYADLSLETAARAGMWRRRPERELVDGWIERALELAEESSATRAKALLARCAWAPAGSADAAREASEIAERLDDPELRSYAWDARGITAWVAGEPDLGRAWEERRFELLDRISDPDHVADIHYAPVTGCVWLGYFGEARRLAGRHDEIVSGLTPHHRIHGVAVLAEVEELAGDWERIRELEPRTEQVVLGNRETPCVRSPRTLLLCALAEARLGDPERARVLEEHAEAFAMEGYGHVLDTPRIRLALVRGEADRVERLLAEPLPDRGWHRGWLLLSTWAARLDALAALARRDELEAWPGVRPRTYLEPFLLRALGLVREDEHLIERAAELFDAFRLPSHAADTRLLLTAAGHRS